MKIELKQIHIMPTDEFEEFYDFMQEHNWSYSNLIIEDDQAATIALLRWGKYLKVTKYEAKDSSQ